MAILQIAIKKGGGMMEVDTERLEEGCYIDCLKAGIELKLNTRQSNVPSAKAQAELEETGAEGAKAVAAHRESAMKTASENLEKLYNGTFKSRKAATAANKVSREVNTEALRLAREVVRDAIKAAGMKISHVKLSDISSAAKDMIAADPSYFEQAKINIEANKTKATTVGLSLEKLKAMESPELVKKAAAKKAESKTKSKDILSATQAGLVAARRKPTEAPVTH